MIEGIVGGSSSGCKYASGYITGLIFDRCSTPVQACGTTFSESSSIVPACMHPQEPENPKATKRAVAG